MPLHDHFHPPWSVLRPWEGFHSAWATSIAYHLNSGVLPSEYFAMPLVQIEGRVEVDVGTFQEEGSSSGAAIATALWAPPAPAMSVVLDGGPGDTFEVQVMREFGGPQLRAAIELISPSNKDRSSSRHAFAEKCAGYLRRGVSVVIIDVVTERAANLHNEIVEVLEKDDEAGWTAETGLYAVAYRRAGGNGHMTLEIWHQALEIGAALPELPLWLEADLSIPLRLEESYSVTCASLRMRD